MRTITFLTIAVFLSLLSSVQAEAASSRDLENTRDYALTNRGINQPYTAVVRGEKIVTTVLSVNSDTDLGLCKTYRQTVIVTDRRTGKPEVESDVRHEACLMGYNWVVPGSREHQKFVRDQERLARSAANNCRSSKSIRSQSNVAREARRQARNLERGRGFDATPVVTEAVIGAILVDSRTSTSCHY